MHTPPTSGGVFLELVPDRSASTLLLLVRKYVLPGSTIITDKWKSYCGISKMEVELRYLHQEVDHSKNFIDPKTGVSTNRIEAMWNSCKNSNNARSTAIDAPQWPGWISLATTTGKGKWICSHAQHPETHHWIVSYSVIFKPKYLFISEILNLLM